MRYMRQEKQFSITMVLFTILSFFQKAKAINLTASIENDYDLCIYEIIKESIRSNTLIVPLNKELEHDSFLDREVYSTDLLQTYPTITYNMDDDINRIIKWNLRYKQMYLVEFKSVDGLRSTLNVSASGRIWKERVKFLISSRNYFDDPKTILSEITEYLSFKKIFNFIILLPVLRDDELLFNLYSWNAFEGEKCNNDFTNWSLEGFCHRGNLTAKTNMLRHRPPKKYNECVMRVAAVHWPPFVMQSNSSSSISDYAGIEINLLEMIASMLNTKIRFYNLPKSARWGRIYPNGTATGVLKMLLEESVDIGVGSFGVSLNGLVYLDLTIPYIQDKVVWCVPRVQPLPEWRIIMDLFVSNVMIIMVVTFLVFCGVFFAVSSFTNSTSTTDASDIIFKLIAITLGTPLRKMPRYIFIRAIFLIWVWLSMYLTIFFQSSLTSAITHPAPRKQLDTVEEIFEKGYDIDIFDVYENFFVDQNDYWSTRVSQEKKECKRLEKCFEDMAVFKTSAMVASRNYYAYVSHKYLDENSRPLIHRFKDNIATYSLHMVQTKKYYLRDRIDHAIRSICAAGYMDFWVRRIRYEINMEERKFSVQDKRITMTHLKSVFVTLIAGHILSTIVLFCELVEHKLIRRSSDNRNEL